MVLDAKALTWAAQNNIDTAKLKAAKVPIYGKWYFPEIPAGVPMVNLQTGEQLVYPERMIAGEVIFVPSADLRRVGLAPEGFAPLSLDSTTRAPETSEQGMRVLAPEPLLAMARPPGYETQTSLAAFETPEAVPANEATGAAGIHMPTSSIAPFVLAIGFCILALGAITHWIILMVGVVWLLAGCIGWIRIGLLESRSAAAHLAHAAEVEPVE